MTFFRDCPTKRDWNSSTPDTETDHFADGSVKSNDNGATVVSYTYDILGRMDMDLEAGADRRQPLPDLEMSGMLGKRLRYLAA